MQLLYSFNVLLNLNDILDLGNLLLERFSSNMKNVTSS